MEININQLIKNNIMKLERIEIPDYTLWVSDEEYKINEIIVETKLGWIMKATEHGLPNYNPNKKKVIAHQPKGNDKELDLPLLPEIVISYSEVDLRKAILIARRHDVDLHNGKGCTLIPQKTEDEIIQSLKKSKQPKYFEVEIDNYSLKTINGVFTNNPNYGKPKTEIINGKTYLKGRYL